MTQTTFYSKSYVGWPPVHVRDYADPNSSHWEQQARISQRRLCDSLGSDEYRTWAELTWPGDSIDDQSWKQIHDTCQDALALGDKIFYQLDCTCNPAGGDACPVCKANARIREREEYSR